jgi:hypothetical protein
MATLTKSALKTVASKEDRARKVLTSQGVTVHTPSNAKGNRVTYQLGKTKLAFMQTLGGWVELNSEAEGKFPSDLLGDIANHLRFYKRLVEA